MKTVYLRIDGRVQRVGFRRWAMVKAMTIGGLSGWVRNMDDGSVEILVKGSEDNLNEFISCCYEGPLLSRVDTVSVLDILEYSCLPGIKEGRFYKYL